MDRFRIQLALVIAPWLPIYGAGALGAGDVQGNLPGYLIMLTMLEYLFIAPFALIWLYLADRRRLQLPTVILWAGLANGLPWLIFPALSVPHLVFGAKGLPFWIFSGQMLALGMLGGAFAWAIAYWTPRRSKT